MKKSQKALRVLRRNLAAAILFALLLPFFVYSIGEDMRSVGMISVMLLVFASINLGYVQKAERALSEDLKSKTT